MKVVYINVGGERRPIKFGTNATALFCKEHKISLKEIGGFLSEGEMTIEKYRDLLWASLTAGAQSAGKDFPFTKYQVGDWIDDMADEDNSTFLNEMNGLVNSQSNGSKKKAVKKKTLAGNKQ